jgi:hypothetical protein
MGSPGWGLLARAAILSLWLLALHLTCINAVQRVPVRPHFTGNK